MYKLIFTAFFLANSALADGGRNLNLVVNGSLPESYMTAKKIELTQETLDRLNSSSLNCMATDTSDIAIGFTIKANALVPIFGYLVRGAAVVVGSESTLLSAQQRAHSYNDIYLSFGSSERKVSLNVTNAGFAELSFPEIDKLKAIPIVSQQDYDSILKQRTGAFVCTFGI